MTNLTQRIVILGGGFAGVYTALHLERILKRVRGVQITLISDENYLLFTPMLPEVPSSFIEPRHIISPIRAFFRKVRFLNIETVLIDLERRAIIGAHCPACEPYRLEFDHLVLALGSKTHFHNLPGVSEHALPMKTLSDAMALRNHLIDLFEHADMQTDPQMRKAMLTFVVAGGGFAGAETAAEIRDFAHTARRYYPSVRSEEVRVVLVHSGSRVMPEISPVLAGYALKKLRAKGVDVLLNTRVRSASADDVELTDGTKIPARTLVWTAGITPNPLLASLPCRRSSHGRIMVDEFLAVPGYPGVWAVGDCAQIAVSEAGEVHPPSAQHAVQAAKAVSKNVAASIRNATQKPFRYRPYGSLASLGRRSAIAEIGGVRFSGFFAWWLWRTIYLLKLPGLHRKVRVAIDWTLDLFFRRDIVLLKTSMNKDMSGMQNGTQRGSVYSAEETSGGERG